LNDIEILVIGSTVKYHDDIDEEAKIDDLINHDPGERVHQNEGHPCWSHHAGEYEHQCDEQVPVIEAGVLRVPHVLDFVLSQVHPFLFLFQFVLLLLSWAELIIAIMLLYQYRIDAFNTFFDYAANGLFICVQCVVPLHCFEGICVLAINI
jgi:hypothetical protein